MSVVKEKVAYLKGLMDGSEFGGAQEREREIWKALVDVLEEVADSLEEVRLDQAELEDYMEAIDSDLADMEENLYEESGDDDDEEDFVEVECPNCKQTVCFEEGFLYDDNVEITCPECGEVIFTGEDYETGDIDSVAEDVDGSTED